MKSANFYMQDFGGGLILILMNMEAWNAMSGQDQKIMMDTWADASKESARGSIAEGANGKQSVLDAGKKLTYPTPEETAA